MNAINDNWLTLGIRCIVLQKGRIALDKWNGNSNLNVINNNWLIVSLRSIVLQKAKLASDKQNLLVKPKNIYFYLLLYHKTEPIQLDSAIWPPFHHMHNYNKVDIKHIYSVESNSQLTAKLQQFQIIMPKTIWSSKVWIMPEECPRAFTCCFMNTFSNQNTLDMFSISFVSQILPFIIHENIKDFLTISNKLRKERNFQLIRS